MRCDAEEEVGVGEGGFVGCSAGDGSARRSCGLEFTGGRPVVGWGVNGDTKFILEF